MKKESKSKKIFFDLMVCQPVSGSKFHGGGEYTKTVFKELCTNYLDQITLYVFYDPSRFIDEWILEMIDQKKIVSFRVHTYDEVSALKEFQEADTLVACLLQGVDKLKKPMGMKVIGVYHGFRSLEKTCDITAPLYENTLSGVIKEQIKIMMGERFFQRKYSDMKKKINACTDIVGVSEHSGYAARVFFPEFDQSHVHVFYSPKKYIEPIDKIENVHTEKAILMLGGNRWIKNVYRGILALDELFSNKQLEGYNVKIVGGIPQQINRRIVNKSRFISLDYLSTTDLEKMYMACDFFFYPTLNEGFGYPPQEAMKYGKTCVVSAISSLPEIYKDSVYYCNPYDLNEMRTRLIQASEKKIESDYIRENYLRIEARQKKDLAMLCSLICK